MILLGAKYLTTSEAGKVLVIDTEMAEYYVHRNLVRLHKLVGWPENENNERMTMLQFREMSTDKRFEMFTRAIETFKPDLVFIDGVRDLIVNFNDIDATVTLIDEIMRLSNVYQCHICSIIHENKNDNTLRGHLGTELQNKSETVIAVRQTEGSMSIAMPAMTRNFPFDKFEFGFNSEGLPYFRDYAIAEHPNLNQSVAVSVTDHTISKREREEEETKTEETNLFANINGEQQQLPF
jgi:RecA-family ATPase